MYAENLEAAEEVIRRLFDPRRTYKKAYISPEIKLAYLQHYLESRWTEIVGENLARSCTIDGTSYKMGDVYTIIATQNPIEQEGTYRLPEAQLDRFLMKITMGYPSLDDEVEILRRHNEHTSFARLEDVEPIITKEELTELRKMMDSVVVDPSLLRYIAQIVGESRESAAVYVGCSPRASVAMLNCAKAYALIGGRDFVVPDDIKTVAPYIMQHRLQLTAESEMEGFTPIAVAHKLIDKVEVPK